MADVYLHTNNASSNLRNAITSVGQTTVTVTSGHGTLFPNPTTGQSFFVTVEDRRTGRREIMLCTSRSGDTLTVQRGKQGTIPQTFSIGVNVSNRITAQILNEFAAATVAEVPLERLPQIPSSQIVNLDAIKVVGPGKLATTVIPPITSAMISALDAAKITTGILPDARLPVPMAASHLPVIPAALLTSVPAASLTGTISMNRIATEAITDAKIADLNAAKLTGTINEARMPAAFDISGGIVVRNLIVSASPGNASIAGYLNVGTTITADKIDAQLVHTNHGGYVNIGAYSSTYGSGYGTFYWNDTASKFVFNGGVHSASVGFIGSGVNITGVVKSDDGQVESMRMLLGPGGGHSTGSVYNGTDLRTPSFQVDSSSNNLDISFSGGPGGHWRAMQSGSASSTERCLGLFVRVD